MWIVDLISLDVGESSYVVQQYIENLEHVNLDGCCPSHENKRVQMQMKEIGKISDLPLSHISTSVEGERRVERTQHFALLFDSGGSMPFVVIVCLFCELRKI